MHTFSQLSCINTLGFKKFDCLCIGESEVWQSGTNDSVLLQFNFMQIGV